MLAVSGTSATASRSDSSTPSKVTRRLRNGSAVSSRTQRICSRLARSSSSVLPLLAAPMSPDTVSTTSPLGDEISSPAARVPSSTTCGDEAFGPAAWDASSCLPPQAATASATTTSRMLRPTASPSGASI